MHRPVLAIVLTLLVCVPGLRAEDTPKPDFPPGWLPINKLDEKPTWGDFRKIDDKIHLYLPKDVKTVRGVFACFVFHSQDPRELADLWEFTSNDEKARRATHQARLPEVRDKLTAPLRKLASR